MPHGGRHMAVLWRICSMMNSRRAMEMCGAYMMKRSSRCVYAILASLLALQRNALNGSLLNNAKQLPLERQFSI